MRCAAAAALLPVWALSWALTAPAQATQQVEAAGMASASSISPSPSSPSAAADSPAPTARVARVTLRFEQPGALVSRYTLAVDEDGKGSYAVDQSLQPAGAEGGSSVTSSQHVEQRMVLTRATTVRIFQLARSLNRFNIPCTALTKDVANIGKKTLSYTGPGGDGSCAYMYSGNKNIMALTGLLQAIANTLDLGRKMEFDHRFDRLGLDEDMSTLTAAVAEGSAAELGTISRTLRSIAQDDELLERVRGRAASLLQRFPPAE
ncbi:MAG TPA: hypothetical protein VNW54_08530 [Granulicella sp.]|nr:hypothetical protein [Granulicella sp.]